MSFVDYNTNNVGNFLRCMGLMSTWVEPKYETIQKTPYENSETSQSDTESVAVYDAKIKRAVAASLPASPKKNAAHRRRAVTVAAIDYTPIRKTTIRFTLTDITNAKTEEKQVVKQLKPALKQAGNPKAYAKEIPEWWTPELPSLLTTAEANVGLNSKFDRSLIYEYVRQAHKTSSVYQERLEGFLPKRLKALLTIIEDKQFIAEIKQFNSMVDDNYIARVKSSFELARFNILNKFFQ
jgi:hypothetical protein